MNNEINRSGACRTQAPRLHPAALLGWVLAALAVPAAAQPIDPPGWWLAESPGTGGARFGLGIDFRWQDLDSFSNTAASQIGRGPDQNLAVVPGDPALNNCRFDYGVEVRSWGIQAPIALGRLPLGGNATLYPSLVLEAATTETTFEFHDGTRAGDTTSLRGRGVSWGAGLEGVAALGRGGWFLAGDYRFRSLPEVDLDGAPPVDVPLELVEQEVSLDGDTHLASLRLGRAFAGGRVAPYVGARRRWSEIEIADRVLLDLGRERFDFTTGSRFEGDSTLAVAGVDGRLGRRLVGRAEVAFGDGAAAALVKAVYLVPSRGRLRPPAPDVRLAHHPRRGGEPERIARGFERIEEDFAREAQALGSPSAAGYVARGIDLLDRTERAAVEVLQREGYFGLADWVHDRAEESREGLRRCVPAASLARRRAPVPVAVVASLGPPPQEPAPADPAGADDWLDGFARALRLVFVRAEEECLEIEVGFAIDGVDRASVLVHLRGVPASDGTLIRANQRPQRIRIGSYSYRIDVAKPQALKLPCDARTGGPTLQCPLDLVRNPVTTVECELGALGGGTCVYGERYRHCRGR